jgi:hypothetical protein
MTLILFERRCSTGSSLSEGDIDAGMIQKLAEYRWLLLYGGGRRRRRRMQRKNKSFWDLQISDAVCFT